MAPVLLAGIGHLLQLAVAAVGIGSTLPVAHVGGSSGVDDV